MSCIAAFQQLSSTALLLAILISQMPSGCVTPQILDSILANMVPHGFDEPVQHEVSNTALNAWTDEFRGRILSSQQIRSQDNFRTNHRLERNDIHTMLKAISEEFPITGISDIINVLLAKEMIMMHGHNVQLDTNCQELLENCLTKDEKVIFTSFVLEVSLRNYLSRSSDEVHGCIEPMIYLLGNLQNLVREPNLLELQCVEQLEIYYDTVDINPTQCRLLAERAHSLRLALFGSDHLSTIQAVYNLASAHMELAEYEQALKLLHEVLDYRTKNEDQNTQGEIIDCLASIGSVLNSMGKFNEAKEYLHQSLERSERIWGGENTKTLSIRQKLGNVALGQGHYHEAANIFTNVYETNHRLLGEKHEDTLIPLTNLAITLRKTEQIDKAIATSEHALRLRREVSGFQHPYTLMLLQNLGVAYDADNRQDDAELCYKEAYEGFVLVFGEEHPKTLLPLHNLGVLYRKQERFKESQEHHDKCLTIRKAILGDDHPETMTTVYCLALLAKAQGHYTQAINYAIDVYERRKKILGPEHPDTRYAGEIAGESHFLIGDYRQAAEVGKKLVDEQKSQNDDTIKVLTSIATCHEKLNEWETALEYHSKAYDCQCQQDPKSEQMTILLQNRGYIWEMLNNYDQAIDDYVTAYKILLTHLSDDISTSRPICTQLARLSRTIGELYTKNDAEEEALSWYRKSLEHETFLKSDRRLDSLVLVAESLFALKEWDESIDYHLKALKELKSNKTSSIVEQEAKMYLWISLAYRESKDEEKSLKYNELACDAYESVCGKNSLDTLRAYHNRGTCYFDMGNYKDALYWYRYALQKKEEVLGVDHASTKLTADCIVNTLNFIRDSNEFAKL